MELLTQARQYLVPALISFLAMSLLKMGMFVTPVEMEQSLRQIETTLRNEYATRQDIADIKILLNRLDDQLNKIDDRLNNRTSRGGTHDS